MNYNPVSAALSELKKTRRAWLSASPENVESVKTAYADYKRAKINYARVCRAMGIKK